MSLPHPTHFVFAFFSITHTFGLATNPVLQRASEVLLAGAVRPRDETHEPHRLLAGLWYWAVSWPVSRLVAGKPEANAQGTNRRFVVTNHAEASRYPEATDNVQHCCLNVLFGQDPCLERREHAAENRTWVHKMVLAVFRQDDTEGVRASRAVPRRPR